MLIAATTASSRPAPSAGTVTTAGPWRPVCRFPSSLTECGGPGGAIRTLTPPLFFNYGIHSLMFGGYPPTAIGYTPTAIGYPPTAIGYPPTAIGYPPAAIVGRIGHSEFFFSFHYGTPWWGPRRHGLEGAEGCPALALTPLIAATASHSQGHVWTIKCLNSALLLCLLSSSHSAPPPPLFLLVALPSLLRLPPALVALRSASSVCSCSAAAGQKQAQDDRPAGQHPAACPGEVCVCHASG